jgi:cytochrome c oxidase subunit 3
MSVATTTATTVPAHETEHLANHGHELSYAVQLRSNRLGLWLFCFSEIFLFGALLIVRFSLWADTRPELSQVIGLITTSVLLLSSYFMNRAETAIAHNDRGRFLRGLLMTALLGTIFFIGVVVLEWNIFGLEAEILGIELFGHLRPLEHGVYAGVFYAMTGVHALHVVSGIAIILFVWRLGRRGHFSAEEHWGVEATAIYWHYVDVVWVFFYPALYLMGRAVPI